MRQWKNSGFSLDFSLRIEAEDVATIQRVIEYVARSPFSLARIISVNPDGKVVCRASKSDCHSSYDA